jgi:hypothetical protein
LGIVQEIVSLMKKVLAILLIVLLGIALGVGVATLRLRSAPWNPVPDEGEPATGPSSTSGKPATKVAQFSRPAVVAGFDDVE